ncbi:cell division protein FtsQ/DivIB [Paenisporosarcina cavernae]|uniref:Cell division protein DivIB n=1 Tax=Paenisporosarcina cavernae TaxID=2320858 RepID=A0A385YUL3_9BACL|nr:cell division protein FtsQ/DivIB [Paenisporosarcina cavernae]AYC29163.1 FtsQ-type POTRA domain-containing protein [Paenisporosarcina cavernae]
MEKIIDIEDRIPTLRERRKKRTNRKFTILLFLFLMIIVSILYFQSSYSKIQSFVVQGEAIESEAFYEQLSTLKKGQSMWDFRASKIEQLIANETIVQKADVKRTGLTEVTISITEWKTKGFVFENDTYYAIFENGEQMDKPWNEPTLEGPILIGFENKKTRKKMVHELSDLHTEVYSLLSEIYCIPSKADPYKIKVFLNDGNEVRAVIPSFADKFNYYPSILAQITPDVKGVIDLEVGSYFQTYEEMYQQQEEGDPKVDESDQATSE